MEARALPTLPRRGRCPQDWCATWVPSTWLSSSSYQGLDRSLCELCLAVACGEVLGWEGAARRWPAHHNCGRWWPTQARHCLDSVAVFFLAFASASCWCFCFFGSNGVMGGPVRGLALKLPPLCGLLILSGPSLSLEVGTLSPPLCTPTSQPFFLCGFSRIRFWGGSQKIHWLSPLSRTEGKKKDL